MSRIAPLSPVSVLIGWGLFVCVASIGLGAAQPCVQPPNGLVSWWPGDGHAEDMKKEIVEAAQSNCGKTN
jgi:hypothetical protein